MNRMFLQLVLLTSALSGCAKPVEVFPVEGKVSIKVGLVEGLIKQALAEPVANARILFVPEDAEGLPAEGWTRHGGVFVLETPTHGRGALAGAYRVVVETPPKFKHGVADHYSEAAATPLRVEVPEGGSDKVRLVLESIEFARKR